MNSIVKEQVENKITSVKHPAIDLSLTTLGIVKEIKVTDEKAVVTFAFPFPNIPFASAGNIQPAISLLTDRLINNRVDLPPLSLPVRM